MKSDSLFQWICMNQVDYTREGASTSPTLYPMTWMTSDQVAQRSRNEIESSYVSLNGFPLNKFWIRERKYANFGVMGATVSPDLPSRRSRGKWLDDACPNLAFHFLTLTLASRTACSSVAGKYAFVVCTAV